MKRALSLLMVIAGLATLLPLAAQAQTIRYVDASKAGSGGSWADAYASLDTALAASTTVGDSIYVAKGTYVPATTFTMKSGVAVYGGFPIGGSAFSARNWVNNVTVLSGDVGGTDIAGVFGAAGNRTDNRATVVTATGVTGALLDGFKIRGGYNGTSGGLQISAGVDLVVSNCWITDNQAAGAGGGGAGMTGASTVKFVNTIISTNFTSNYGGGFGAQGSFAASITFINCTVYGNVGTSRGGGIYYQNVTGAGLMMTNTIVWGNILTTAARNNVHIRGSITNPKSDYCHYSLDSGTYTAGANDVRLVDPVLVNPTALDYHLTSGSGCKDTGLAGVAPAKDYDLVTRDATPDRGAYEYVAAGDTIPPAEVTGYSVGTAGHKFLTLGWTNPGDGDFGGVLVIRKAGSAPTFTPGAGASYTLGQTVGDGTVAYVSGGTGFTDSSLDNGQIYYYKICTYDTPAKNYSTGVGVSGTPVADTTPPDAVTGFTLTGQDSAIKLDWTNPGSDFSGVLILRKTGSAPTATPVASTVYTAGNTIDDGTVVYVGTGSSATPGAASTWTDSSLTQELTTYGYSIFAYDVAPNYSTRADGTEATLTDNTAPGDVTAQTATGDDGEVVLRWTNPASIDIQGVLILRSTAGTPTGVPVAGTTYTTSDTIGGDAVVFVGGSATPSSVSAWSDQGLNNTTPYYYKIFARDEHPNFAGGVAANATPTAPSSVKYVNAAVVGGDGDGSTWDNAYNSLVTALSAVSGGELWVAAGTYKPGTLTTDRFTMKNNVKLYGGFTSTMAHRYERNWVTHPTILSGDVNNDDGANWSGRSDNAANVVWADGVIGGVVLDGFQVTGGYGATYGAGIYIGTAGIRVENCIITNNCVTSGAGWGGGIGAISGATGTLVNCLIAFNKSNYRGGGVGMDGYSAPYCRIDMMNCTISSNEAPNEGSGLYERANTVDLCSMTNTIVWGNFGATGIRVRNMTIRAINCAHDPADDTLTGSGNITLDPLFANAPAGDFRLITSSPCKDSGTANGAPLRDLDLTSRPQGAGYDMGAYEYASVDLTPPADVSGVGVTPGCQLLDLAWTNPGSDFSGVMILRKEGSAPTGTPTPGLGYSVSDTITDGTVVYVGSGTSLQDMGLTIGTDYYYMLFAFDSLHNYAAGVGDHGVPTADTTPPEPVTGLAAAAQSDSAIRLDWVNSSSTDLQGVLILRKTGGVPTGTPVDTTVYTAGTGVGDGTVIYVGAGSSGTPGAASTWTDSTLPDASTTYGYSVFARDNAPNYSTRADGSDTTLADNTPPGNVTALTATGDDGQVALAWTHPSDTDVQGVLVLRSTAGTPGATPVAGTDYTVGQAFGDSTVVYVSSGATPGSAGAWSDQDVVNGTHYYYKIFARDERPNYASGAPADAMPTGPSVKFVNGAVGAEGNGSSWGNAFKTLTNALFNAAGGDEIWVAAGTYKPGTLTTDRFNLKSGVKLYGGFTSGMAHRYERDWTTHLTTLSGDLTGNDGAGWAGRTDNAVQVLYADGITGSVVDGFTVRGGYGAANGAGMYVNNSTSTVANCVFTDNYAAYGGGLYFYSTFGAYTTGRVENCLIYGNYATGFGGGIDTTTGNTGGQATPVTLVNCTIWGNTANGNRGGGVYCQYAQTYIQNSIVWGNFKSLGVANNVHMQGPTTISVSHSDANISSGDGYVDNGGNINWTAGSDPLFVNAAGGDFRLSYGSPCIDAGTSAGAPALDIRGTARPAGGGIDIGAYESTVYTVTVNPAAGVAGATVTFNGQAYSVSTVVPVEAGSYTASYTSPQAAGATTQYVFSAWTLDGSAVGSSPATIVVSSANRVLNATFTKKFKLALTVIGSAYGSVSGGINGSWYDSGDVLQLDSHPLPRAVFVGWAGDCIGGEVTMDGAKSVTATFDSTDPTFIMFQ